jgi:simple sugar transport system substrate-binding protein
MKTMNNQRYTIATVGKIAPHPWFDRMEKGVKKFATDTGHHTFLRCPSRIDEVLEEQTIRDVLAQDVDALCVVAFFPHALEMILSKARAHGTVIITHEAPNQRNNDYDIEAFDNFAYGAHLMDLLAENMGQQGEYSVFLESLITQSHSRWAKGAIRRQQEKYPNMTFVAKKIEHHEDQSLAYSEAKKLFQRYPDLRGILALGGASVVGAANVAEETGVSSQIKIVGNALVSVGGKYLKRGTVQLISFWDPADAGYVMNALALMTLEGKKITEGMDLGVPGYHHLNMDGKVLYGSAWIDVTKDTMLQYNF